MTTTPSAPSKQALAQQHAESIRESLELYIRECLELVGRCIDSTTALRRFPDEDAKQWMIEDLCELHMNLGLMDQEAGVSAAEGAFARCQDAVSAVHRNVELALDAVTSIERFPQDPDVRSGAKLEALVRHILAIRQDFRQLAGVGLEGHATQPSAPRDPAGGSDEFDVPAKELDSCVRSRAAGVG